MNEHIKVIKQMSLNQILAMRVKVSNSLLNNSDKEVLNIAMDARVDQLEARRDNLVEGCNEL